jgi:hypothetical protein
MRGLMASIWAPSSSPSSCSTCNGVRRGLGAPQGWGFDWESPWQVSPKIEAPHTMAAPCGWSDGPTLRTGEIKTKQNKKAKIF